MKRRPRRTVQPLPSYTRRKPLADGKWGYYFEPPSWARKPKEGDDRGPCPVGAEELGTDYGSAVERVERVLLPLFDSWRTRGLSDMAAAPAPRGTLDWLFGEYRARDEFKKLDKKTRRLHERGFHLVGGYVLKDGRKLGSIKLASIDSAVTDAVYAKLVKLPGAEPSPELALEPGQEQQLERRTTVNHAMKSCRRAWNVVRRAHPRDVPESNPFAKMGLRSSKGETPTAFYPDLVAAVRKADELGLFSLGTALMVTWEWLQREEHIFTAFQLDHYRPKRRPDEVLIVHPKTGEKVWVPLFDRTGPEPVALFPELMARMDRLKRDRIGADSLFFVRDWVDKSAKLPLPWVTKSGDITLARKKTKLVVLAAGLPDDLSFTSFRHGGLTELGDSDLTDAQIRALSRQTSDVLPRYVKRTQRQIIAGTHKRRAMRPAAPEHPEAEQLTFFDVIAGGKK